VTGQILLVGAGQLLSESANGIAARKTAGTACSSLILAWWVMLFSEGHWNYILDPAGFHLRLTLKKPKLHYDGWPVFQSVLVSGTYPGPTTNFFPSLLSLDSCKFVDVGCPLWPKDGSVTYNRYRALLAPSFLVLSPRELVTILYCLKCQTPQPGGPDSIFISPQIEVAPLCNQAWVKSKLFYDWWSFGQPVLVLGSHVGPITKLLLLSAVGLSLWDLPLRQEDRSVIYSCCWSLLVQLFSGLCLVGLNNDNLLSQIQNS
jgi:hypothetical protein